MKIVFFYNINNYTEKLSLTKIVNRPSGPFWNVIRLLFSATINMII